MADKKYDIDEKNLITKFNDRTQVRYSSIIIGPPIIKDDIGSVEIAGGEREGNLRSYKNRCFIISIWFTNSWIQKTYQSPHHLLQTLVDLGHIPPTNSNNESTIYAEDNIIDVMHKLQAKYYYYQIHDNKTAVGPYPLFYNDWRIENWIDRSYAYLPGINKNNPSWNNTPAAGERNKLLTTGQNEMYKKIVLSFYKPVACHFYTKILQPNDITNIEHLYILSDHDVNRKISRN